MGIRYQIRQREQLLDVYDGGENEGVPYSWGMSSGLIATQHDLEIPINPPMQAVFMPISRSLYETLPFDEIIDNKFFAGNQNHDTDKGNRQAAGVDCVGLINNAWQMGGRYGMSITKDQYSRPIKFKDLKVGDILMNFDPNAGDNLANAHVMLFDRFDPPLAGEPVAGTTFWVYEAAGGVWKVRHWPYTLADAPAQDPHDPNGELVSLQGLAGKYSPRTYSKIIPIDIVLVIDKSGSMDGTPLARAKEAANTFVDLMRPGDKLGIVAFDTTAYPVYPIIPSQQGGLATIDLDDQNGNEKADAQTAINNISAGGGTSIGNGLYGTESRWQCGSGQI